MEVPVSKLDNGKLSEVSGGLNRSSARDNFSKIFRLDSRELDILSKAGYLDDNDCILKENLKKAQSFLQQSGWNGILYIEGEDFDELPEVISLSDHNNH